MPFLECQCCHGAFWSSSKNAIRCIECREWPQEPEADAKKVAYGKTIVDVSKIRDSVSTAVDEYRARIKLASNETEMGRSGLDLAKRMIEVKWELQRIIDEAFPNCYREAEAKAGVSTSANSPRPFSAEVES
jgi:hypothetical protein